VRDPKLKYRSRPDILASILQSAGRESSGVGITRLMYNSFLSYNQINQYLEVLKENALLKYDVANKKYSITATGLKFLDLYGKMDNMLNITKSVS
jgi:predicted transcriptional regulator